MPGILEKGGFFIWIILLEAVIGLYLILERGVYFYFFLNRCKKDMEGIKSPRDLEEVKRKNLTVLALKDAVAEKRVNTEVVQLVAEKDLQEAERGFTTLSVIAQTAPLLGLLGTITGLIRVFIAIETLGGPASPSDLAGGIWEALLTTAAGLAVGIPVLIAYNYFSSRLRHYERSLFITISRVIDEFRKENYEVI